LWIYEYIQSLLALNPKIKQFANSRPSVQTLKDKQHWKRNEEHKCASVCIQSYSLFEKILLFIIQLGL
jgi:hypothetical protein